MYVYKTPGGGDINQILHGFGYNHLESYSNSMYVYKTPGGGDINQILHGFGYNHLESYRNSMYVYKTPGGGDIKQILASTITTWSHIVIVCMYIAYFSNCFMSRCKWDSCNSLCN